jgi:hypothetical protein
MFFARRTKDEQAEHESNAGVAEQKSHSALAH